MADTDEGAVLRSAGHRTDGCSLGTPHNQRLNATKLEVRALQAAPSSTKSVSLCETGILLRLSFGNYSIDLHCKLRETLRCLLPARGSRSHGAR